MFSCTPYRTRNLATDGKDVLRLAVALLVPVAMLECCGPAIASSDDSKALAPMTNRESMEAGAAHRALFETPVTAAERASLTAQLRKDMPADSPCARIQHHNLIDDFIFGRMARDHVPHACLATDEEFLRRVTLDLTGEIPDSDAVRNFLKDRSPDKRLRLIDSLIGSDAYVDRWTHYFAALFHVGRGNLGPGADLFHMWLEEQLRSNRPFDAWVRDMLTQSGKLNYLGQAAFSYYLSNIVYEKEFVMQEDTNDERTVDIFRDFMGMNISCISCHAGAGHVDKINLWLSKRTREQFWQQSAFLGKTHTVYYSADYFRVDDTGPGYNFKEHSIARPQRWGGPDGPAFLLTGEKPHPSKDPREEMVRLLTSHPQFARATVNRFWAALMGTGLVEPIDGFDLARLDPKNPPPKPWTAQPTNPELLEALAGDFRVHGYDLQRLFRLITQSSAYQLSSDFRSDWKDVYADYYARKLARPLSAEELYDAIVKATGVSDNLVNYGQEETIEKASQVKVKYVMQLSAADDLGAKDLAGVKYWLGAFGMRNANTAPSLLQPMLLMNHDVVKKRVADEHSIVAELLRAIPPLDDEKLIEELYLRTLSRYPRPEEVKLLSQKLNSGDRKAAAEDVEWVLLNKLDFVFNY